LALFLPSADCPGVNTPILTNVKLSVLEQILELGREAHSPFSPGGASWLQVGQAKQGWHELVVFTSGRHNQPHHIYRIESLNNATVFNCLC
jgi:hypothetical protein